MALPYPITTRTGFLAVWRYFSRTVLFAVFLLISHSALAQCEPPKVNDYTSCTSGEYSLSVYSMVATSFRWYYSNSPGSAYFTPPMGTGNGGTVKYSEYKQWFSATTTYYVSALCSSGESARVPVTFTLGTQETFSLGITFNASGTSPTFCSGDKVIFKATKDANYNVSSYTWWMNGSIVQGVTGDTFETPALNPSDLKTVKVSATTTTSTPCLISNYAESRPLQDVPFIVNPKPTAPTVQQPHYVEYNTPATLTASGADSGQGETYRWYTESSGGTPLSSTSTGNITSATTYYVSKYANGCESPRTAFVVSPNRLPVVNAGADITLPGGSIQQTSLNGSATDPDGTIIKYKWTKQSGPTATISTSEAAATSVTGLGPGTYVFRLTATDNANVTSWDEVSVTVPVVCELPSTVGTTRCGPGPGTLSASTSSSDVTSHKWYTAETNGSELTPTSTGTGIGRRYSTYTIDFSVTTTLWVSSVCSTGETPTRTPVTITISPQQTFNLGITFNATSSTPTFCSGDKVIFKATKDANYNVSSYTWWMNGSIVNKTTSTVNPTLPLIAESAEQLKSVKVSATTTTTSPCLISNSAESLTLQDVPFEVNPKPIAPTVQQPHYVDYNTSAILSASGDFQGETYRWYTTSAGGTPLSSTTTGNITVATTYYVSKYNKFRCEGPRIAFVLSPNRLPVVNAGADITLPAGSTQASLVGSATDQDGAISTYNWTEISEPGTASIATPNEASCTISGLETGTYVFRLTASDNHGGVSWDEVTITITALPNSYNYVKETLVRVPNIANVDQVNALNQDQRNITYIYIDGLGRPMQSLQQQSSPTGRDIVTPIVYDQIGMESKKYLPYAAMPAVDKGFYQKTFLADQTSFYTTPGSWSASNVTSTSAGTAFSETVFESSPLNRVFQQGAPGQAWQPASVLSASGGHTTKMEYTTNNTVPYELAGTRQVSQYKVAIASDGKRTLTLTPGAVYKANELYVTIVKDENWTSGRTGTIEIYKDKEGRVLVKRTFNQKNNAVEMLSIYYVYDDFGNLCFVIPPGDSYPDASSTAAVPSADYLSTYCYQYRYDERNRMTEKLIPGKSVEYIVYNKLDQPVATQDGHSRKSNRWNYIKYDAFGRVIYTGWWTGSSNLSPSQYRDSVYARPQYEARKVSTGISYENTAWPTNASEDQINVLNYYDNYTNISGLPADFTFKGYTDLGNKIINNPSNMTRGLPTASKTRSLANQTDKWTVNYYDDEGRVIQTHKHNNLSATSKDVYTNLYDFPGQLKKTRREHYAGTAD
jgi:hypothetical protein